MKDKEEGVFQLYRRLDTCDSREGKEKGWVEEPETTVQF